MRDSGKLKYLETGILIGWVGDLSILDLRGVIVSMCPFCG
jgi:hypothetical protein